MSDLIKSKKRVEEHGEVFTAEREVKAMCDLVADECLRIDSRFLEPACGEGNFLIEVLQRKLSSIPIKYKKVPYEFELLTIHALTSLYGVDILQDNVELCRDRLYKYWNSIYVAVCKPSDDTVQKVARYILEKNIICGNALSMMCVDENQLDTEVPITFTEWTFPRNDFMISRKEYRLDVLLKANTDSDNYTEQLGLFGDDAMNQENWMIDPVTNDTVPKPIKIYEIKHYRRLLEDE